MNDYERILHIACVYIIIALLNLVVAVSNTVEAAEIEDTWVECAECVALMRDDW